jgi:hypothetical protein
MGLYCSKMIMGLYCSKIIMGLYCSKINLTQSQSPTKKYLTRDRQTWVVLTKNLLRARLQTARVCGP